MIKPTNISHLLLGKSGPLKIALPESNSHSFRRQKFLRILGTFLKIIVIVLCCLKIGQKHFELSQTLTAHFEEKTIQSKELSTTGLSFFLTDTDLLAFD